MRLNDLVQRVRAHPGIADSEVAKLSDDNFAFAVAQLVFPVLQDLAEEVGRSFGAKRQYTFTDPSTTTVTLDPDGSADLGTLIAEKGLLLENLQFGEIRHPSSIFKLEPCASSDQGRLPGNYDATILHYWLVGFRVFTRSLDSNVVPLAGDLSFACPHVNGLDDLSPQLNDDVTEAIAVRLKGSFNLTQAMPPQEQGAAQ